MHGFSNVGHVFGWQPYITFVSLVNYLIFLDAFVTWYPVEVKSLDSGDTLHCYHASFENTSVRD